MSTRSKTMGQFFDRTFFLTGVGAQSATDEQNKVFNLLTEFLDDAPPPLRAMPALADLLIAAYEVGKVAR